MTTAARVHRRILLVNSFYNNSRKYKWQSSLANEHEFTLPHRLLQRSMNITHENKCESVF